MFGVGFALRVVVYSPAARYRVSNEHQFPDRQRGRREENARTVQFDSIHCYDALPTIGAFVDLDGVRDVLQSARNRDDVLSLLQQPQ
jgi:hypothetical protein